jgi:hypothetical protein
VGGAKGLYPPIQRAAAVQGINDETRLKSGEGCYLLGTWPLEVAPNSQEGRFFDHAQVPG